MSKMKQKPVLNWQHHLRIWGGALIMFCVLSAGLMWGGARVLDPQFMPVKVVEVDGEIRFMQRTILERAVAEAVNGGFFDLDLDRVRSKVEQIPWVDHVSIRRVWPDRLKVRVVEQKPLARWGDQALVNQRGEVFRPEKLPHLPELVLLRGPNDSAATVSKQYQRMEILLGTIGVKLAEVVVNPRRAWRLVTDQGLIVDLGRRSILQRLTRFVQLYPKLLEDKVGLAQVDLRYTNGFTARWEAEPELQTLKETPAGMDSNGRIVGI